MDTFDVRPGSGIGPITIGMTRADAVESAERATLSAAPFRRGSTPALVIDRDLFAYLDGDDRIEEVEVAIHSERAAIWEGSTSVSTQRQSNLLSTSFRWPNRTHPDYPSTIDYPGLGLSVWKEGGAAAGGLA